MPDDPIRYWQDLTENYRQMSDGELLELADKPEDLTDVARQALRDEMKRRGLEAPPADNIASKLQVTHLDRPATVNWEPARARYLPRENEDETDLPHEYTWKTDLCECNTRDEALDIGLVLKNAGIDSWISTPESKWGLGGPRIQVAADQLDQAQMILAHYTPPARVNEEQEVDEFILPVCPRCGSKEDAVLQAADPVNAWMCEACGAEWANSDSPGEEGAAGRD